MGDDKGDTVIISRAEYEQRHAVLESRVTRVEERMCSLATREDIQATKAEIVTEIAKLIPTTTDVDWLKWGVRAIAVAAISFGFGLALHLIGKI